eukprot:m.150119 g.150119  ORF g.150119 m.150119 type:complete len:51 (-) comp17368_c0_seq6:4-156(-)
MTTSVAKYTRCKPREKHGWCCFCPCGFVHVTVRAEPQPPVSQPATGVQAY